MYIKKINVSKKINKPRFNPKFLKTGKKIMKLLSVEDSLFIFIHMVHWSFVLGQGWLLSNNFCMACQNCLRPIFVIVHNAVWMRELLLCCDSSCRCHHAAQIMPINLDKNNFDALQNLLLCSHPWLNMNEYYVPNESRIIMLSKLLSGRGVGGISHIFF